jgi:hypothetical protein
MGAAIRGCSKFRGWSWSTNDEVEHIMKKSPQGVAVEQNKAQGEKTSQSGSMG